LCYHIQWYSQRVGIASAVTIVGVSVFALRLSVRNVLTQMTIVRFSLTVTPRTLVLVR